MTFNSYELSNYDGRPVRLYEILYGSRTWYYNNSDRDLVLMGHTYLGSNFGDSGIMQSGDPTSDTLTIDCPGDIPIVDEWRGTPPTETVYLTIRDTHFGDPDAQAPVVYIGTISDVNRPTPLTAQIASQTLSMTFKRGGLRLTYTRNCPYFLYDVNCTLNPEDFVTHGTVTAVGGDWFECAEVAALRSGRFSGGYVTWERVPGTIEKRGIELSSAARCTLMGTADRLTVGTAVSVYPGCSRVTSVCDGTFNNLVNFGGCPGIPGRSPFDGNPVF